MKSLAHFRPVFVVGIGLHPYQNRSETTYVTLGLRAVREALDDADIAWRDIESAYVGNALIGMAAGAGMLRYLGMSGIPFAQVENASASGSTAFRQSVMEVAAGFTDVSLAMGVDTVDAWRSGPARPRCAASPTIWRRRLRTSPCSPKSTCPNPEPRRNRSPR